jgi:hypothetical protein
MGPTRETPTGLIAVQGLARLPEEETHIETTDEGDKVATMEETVTGIVHIRRRDVDMDFLPGATVDVTVTVNDLLFALAVTTTRRQSKLNLALLVSSLVAREKTFAESNPNRLAAFSFWRPRTAAHSASAV